MHPSVHPPLFSRLRPPFDWHFYGEKNHRLVSMVRLVLREPHPPTLFCSTLIRQHMNDPFKIATKISAPQSEASMQRTPTHFLSTDSPQHHHPLSRQPTSPSTSSSNHQYVQLQLESNHQEPDRKISLENLSNTNGAFSTLFSA